MNEKFARFEEKANKLIDTLDFIKKVLWAIMGLMVYAVIIFVVGFVVIDVIKRLYFS